MSLQANFPTIKPSLMLDFANAKVLDPRITFTRSSTATYYDGETVAKAEENLLTYSQDFDNAAWTKTRLSVTANAVAAPDGTTTAEQTVQSTGQTTSGLVFQTLAITSGSTYSVFAKAGAKGFIIIQTNSGTHRTWFDVSSGTVGTTNANHTASIVSVGNGWYRCIVVNAAVGTSFGVYHAESDNSATVADSGGLYLWGAQLEQRDAVTAYTPTTTAPITNYVPQLMTAASGVPRFTHNPLTEESLGLLIEESRTNLMTYSEQFENASWGKNRCAITTNIVVSPDGTLTADQLVEDTTASNTHDIFKTATVAASTVVTVSVYAKAGGRSEFAFRCANPSFIGRAFFNLATGVVGFKDASVTSSSMDDVGNGWYKCTATFTTGGSGTSANFQIQMAVSGSVTYTGDGYSGIYLWGAQLEAGSFATSYIPTVASTVTRAGDLAVMTDTNFSSWFNPNESTFYAEAATNAVPSNTYHYICSLSLGTSTTAGDFVRMAFLSTLKTDLTLGNTGTFVTLNTSGFPATTVGVAQKSAIAIAVQDLAGTAAAGTMSTSTARTRLEKVDRLTIGNQAALSSNRAMNGAIKKIAYYPARLSNATLQALTK